MEGAAREQFETISHTPDITWDRVQTLLRWCFKNTTSLRADLTEMTTREQGDETPYAFVARKRIFMARFLKNVSEREMVALTWELAQKSVREYLIVMPRNMVEFEDMAIEIRPRGLRQTPSTPQSRQLPWCQVCENGRLWNKDCPTRGRQPGNGQRSGTTGTRS